MTGGAGGAHASGTAREEGRIRVAPLLTCEVKASGMFPEWRAGEFDFLYDARRNDGSYDLVLGPRHPYEEATRLLVIPDVVPPRTKQ